MHFVPALLLLLSIIIIITRNVCGKQNKENVTPSNVSETDYYSIENDTMGTSTEYYTCNDLNDNCTTINVNITELTTTVSPKDVTFNNKTNSNVNKKKFRTSSGETCSCNMNANYCDVNCCCDSDCTDDNKMVFAECIEEIDFVRDTRFCEYVDYIYKNNTLYEWDVNQNGLFCIVKYNLPRTYTIQKEHKIKTHIEGLLQKRGRFHWPLITEKTKDIVMNDTKEQQVGDNVWAFNNATRSVTLFQLPNDITTKACLKQRDIKYLKDVQTVCHLNNIDEDDRRLWAQNYFANLTVISSPKLFNRTILKRSLMCPRNICIEIVPKFCNDHFQDCTNTTGEYKLKMNRPSCRLSIYNDEINCINVVRNVQYIFYHNGSHGIKRAIVRIGLTNFTHKLTDEDLNYYQEFSVKFEWFERELTYSSRRSGNPGYLIGKPILLANLLLNVTVRNVTNGNGTEEIVYKNMSRSSQIFTDNFLTLPTSRDGVCVFDNVTYGIVEFKFDSIHKCKFRVTLKINKTKLANETCQLIQRAIFDYWLVSTKNTTIKVIGDFGNANVNKIDDWSSILYYRNPDDILSNISGHYYYSNDKTTLRCHNVTTILKIDIFHSRVIYKNLYNQEKIIGTIYDFVGLKMLTFNINKNDIIIVNNLLRHEVMFYDITVNNMKKYVDPSTFEIKLPYDFFYPFVKLNNICTRLRPNLYAIYFLIISIKHLI